jgi:hypothetical protein
MWDKKSPTEESGTLIIFSAPGGAAVIRVMSLEPAERPDLVPDDGSSGVAGA